MARVIGAIKDIIWHAVVEIYNNVTFVFKLLVAEKVFEETPGSGLKDIVKNTNTDLLQKRMVALAGNIFLQNYIYHTQGNWSQAGAQVAEGDTKIEPDLSDENSDNLVKRIFIHNDDSE